MWITPKTDWVSTDFINYSDLNRLTNNVRHLYHKALRIAEPFDLKDERKTFSECDILYAEDFLCIIENLDTINENTVKLGFGVSHAYGQNSYAPNYTQLNLIEGFMQRLYDELNEIVDDNTLKTPFRLSHKLGGI